MTCAFYRLDGISPCFAEKVKRRKNVERNTVPWESSGADAAESQKYFATLAQRQSNAFVKRGSSVQIREVAPVL